MIIKMHDTYAELKFPRGAAHIERQMKRQGWYEKVMLEDIKDKLELIPYGPVIDIGAYCGTHTLWFAKMCKRQVIAFEPVRESFDFLVANVKRNNVEDLVTCLNVGIGERNGRANYQRHDFENTGTDTLVADPNGIIEVVPLDHFNFSDVALIKIDVEGMELDVLQGALHTIERWRPLIYVEAPDTITRVRELLEGLGYDQFGEFNATPTFGFKWAHSA